MKRFSSLARARIHSIIEFTTTHRIYRLPGIALLHLLILYLAVSSGCINRDPIPVRNQPNTFTPAAYYHKWAIIDSVIINACVDQYDCPETVWHIQAIHPVFARDLIVTAGVVPNGFIQTVPPPPEKFTLKPGALYSIAILPTEMPDPHHYPTFARWRARE